MAMKRGTLVTLIAILAFGALLLFNTLSAQKVVCDVCVEFKGKRNCATASHSSQDEARRSAQTTACGTISQGMDESIACDRTPPTSVQCRTQ